MTIKIESSRTVIILLGIIAFLLLANLIKPLFIPGKAFAEFNNDSFETDSRNLEEIANGVNSMARSLQNLDYIQNELEGIRRELER